MITKEEKEFMDFVEKHKHLGYGWMMQTISLMWRKEDPFGALSLGTCYGLLEVRKE